MRILYLAFVELDVPNACRIRVVEMIRHLKELRKDILAILPRPLDLSNLPQGVRSICLKWSFSFLGKLVFRLLAAVVLMWQGLRWRPHVLYVREMECNPFPLIFSRLFGVPLVVEINGMLTEKYQRHKNSRWMLPIVQWFQRLELRGAAAIVVPTDFVRDRLIAAYQLDPGKVKFLYPGVDTTQFVPRPSVESRSRLGIPNGEFVIGFVGSALPWYDLVTPLRAMYAVRHHWPDMRYVIVGDGPTLQSVQKISKELGLTDRLVLTGFQPHDRIPDWINSFDVCLVPATRYSIEQYGILTNKFWEYSACGQPSIVSSLPEVPYPCELQGLMIEVIPEDVESFVNALNRCRTQPDKVTSITKAIQAFTVKQCSWRTTAVETVSIFTNLTHEKGLCHVE